MKKFAAPILAFFLFVGLFGCGAGVEVSTEMQGFMDEFKSSKSIVDACQKNGFEAESIPLDLYDLESPSVKAVATEGDNTCYTVNFKHGMVDSDVIICWNGGKVVEVRDVE